MSPLAKTLLSLFAALYLASCGESSDHHGEGDVDHNHEGEATDEGQTEEALYVPENGSVSFLVPANGAQVKSPVAVQFAVEGMEILPAGTPGKATGHHHVLVNQGPFTFGQVIPADETHIHFGKGQTEALLDLSPGKYTLTMQFADFLHRSYGEAMAASVDIEVVE